MEVEAIHQKKAHHGQNVKRLREKLLIDNKLLYL